MSPGIPVEFKDITDSEFDIMTKQEKVKAIEDLTAQLAENKNI